ncbi:MAG TPA: hypothetical protein PLZ42_02320 [Methanothrix sp.]|nr:hypothetical protein [Methanothrix sp.]
MNLMRKATRPSLAEAMNPMRKARRPSMTKAMNPMRKIGKPGMAEVTVLMVEAEEGTKEAATTPPCSRTSKRGSSFPF